MAQRRKAAVPALMSASLTNMAEADRQAAPPTTSRLAAAGVAAPCAAVAGEGAEGFRAVSTHFTFSLGIE
ncbi:hypothetical protein GCM10010388_49950 [Streptomyces mauvecolor]